MPIEEARACNSGRSMADRPVPVRRRREAALPDGVGEAISASDAESRALSGSTSVVSLKVFLP
jgi:hypothetical protein